MEDIETMEAHVGKMEKKFQQWGAKFDEIISRTQDVGMDARGDWHDRIDELKVKRAEAQLKFDELKAAGSEKWVSFRAGLERAWNEFETAVKKLTK